MKIKLLTAAAFGLLMTGAAYATDLAVPAVQMTDPGFDWDGFYAGLTLGGETDFVGGSWVEGGGEAGVIFSLNDNFKVDVSGAFLGYAGTSSGWLAEGVTRLGYAMDNVMIYGLGGIGSDTGAPYFTYGGGVWIAATDNMSVRFEVDGNSYFGSGIVDWASVSAGAFMHF